MQFSSFADFFAMGGYGFYVWLSFGAAFVLLLGLVLNSLLSHKQVKQRIAQQHIRQEKLKRAAKQQKTLSQST
ncbi:heme exporter protein CcmD [Thalassotalea sp. LPB0316]|uniref:heme exporter protein CcmD n=1 Tax=Thalassotalea sp. LPB0316 TaxID=2769490 RepID=UPI001868C2E2|nr:heme exporter protein CcmD [Thalassotalea sp. LPB0316]QOL25871.1 heme exporter protein CcmD [Thalassotalea sp. LPB0316]